MDSERKREIIIQIVYWAMLITLGYLFLKYVFGYIVPFLFAFAVASVLNKPVRKFCGKYGFPTKVTAIAVIAVFYGLIGLGIAFLGAKAIQGMISFLIWLPQAYAQEVEPVFSLGMAQMTEFFNQVLPGGVESVDLSFANLLQGFSNAISEWSLLVLNGLSNKAAALPKTIIKIVLTIIATFFIGCDYENVCTFLEKQVPPSWQEVLRGVRNFIMKKLLFVGRAYFFILCITFSELCIGFFLLGITHGFWFALGIAVFDIIPVLGTGGILIPWAILQFLQGDFSQAIGIMGLYLTVCIVRSVVEPKILGSQIGLHPLLTLIALFLGASLFGLVGFFAAPICLSLVKYLKDEHIITLYK